MFYATNCIQLILPKLKGAKIEIHGCKAWVTLSNDAPGVCVCGVCLINLVSLSTLDNIRVSFWLTSQAEQKQKLHLILCTSPL